MALSCNPAKSGVITPALHAAEVQRQQQKAARGSTDFFEQMTHAAYFLSGFFHLDDLATSYPRLRPYVDALHLGEHSFE